MAGSFGRGVSRRVMAVVGTAAFVASSLAMASAPLGQGSAASGYVSLPSPARLVDTRPGTTTVDGQFAGIGLRAAGSTSEVQIGGRAGVSPTATAVVLTVTAVDALAAGFLTVHATGTARPNASNVNYHAFHNTAGTVLAPLGVDGKVSIYTSAATQLIVDVAGYFPIGSYTPLPDSARLVDTRPGASTIDGQDAGIGLRAAGSRLDVEVAGRGGVPGDATTAVLTVTAVDPVELGFLTVHATGTPRPNSSNVNFYAAHNIANAVIAPIGANGEVSIYTSGATHLIVDVSGHLPTPSYTPLPTSARLTDTRPGGVTFDGQQAATGKVAGGDTLQLEVAGRAGVPADASAAVLTITAVDPYGTGFVTEHPTGTPRPNASVVNYYHDHNTANTVLARIGAGGDVCVFTSSASHFVVDVSGYLTGPPPAAAGPTCPQAPPILAIWPAANVVFETPEEAATDFLAHMFHGGGAAALVGEFMQGDMLSGEFEVLSPGDDGDPTTTFPTGTLLSLRRLGADFGWFVIGASSDGVSITSPEARDVVPAGPLTVAGLGRGFEANVVVWAFEQGSSGPFLDLDFTLTDWSTPTPYSLTLDLSAASPGDVVGLIARGDTGLAEDLGELAAIPVLIAT